MNSIQINRMDIEYASCQSPDMRTKVHLYPSQILLYKDQLRTYKRKLADRERNSREERHQLSDEVLEKEEDVGVNPLLEAKRQMYQAEGMSN